jgi:hypothetical protein
MPGKSYNEKGASGKCLSDEQLYGFLEKLLSKAESQAVQEHLDSCSACFDDMVTLARNVHTPASEAERIELASLPKLPPQEQIAKILEYAKKQESVWVKIWEGIKTIFQIAESFISVLLSSLFGKRDPVWQFVFAGVALLVVAAGSFWGMQYYKKGYRVGKAERLVKAHYQVSVPDQEPRLSGDYAPTGLGTLMGSSEENRPYFAQAFKLTEDAIANGYDSPKAKRLLAQIYILNDQYTQADSILQQLKQDSPTLATALNDLGVIYFRKKNWKMAAQFFAAAIQADPQIKEARYNLALAKIEMGEAAEVIAILDDYIKLETVDGWKDAARRLKRDLQ